MSIKKLIAASAFAFVLSTSAAFAADSCTGSFGKAAAAGEDTKSASLFLEQAGNCCSTDTDSASAQSLANSIKSIVANATSSVAKGGNQENAGKMMSAALGCAGQPSIVAADPTLYSSVLADSGAFAELARDENAGGDLDGKVQFARRAGSLPNNNQQPTVSIEQK